MTTYLSNQTRASLKSAGVPEGILDLIDQSSRSSTNIDQFYQQYGANAKVVYNPNSLRSIICYFYFYI